MDTLIVMENGRIIYQGPYKYAQASDVLEKNVLVTKDNDSSAEEMTESDKGDRYGECRGLDEEEETREAGEVDWRVYRSFFTAGSHPVILVSFLVFYICVQGMISQLHVSVSF